jgi:phosphohistidine phosphatase
MTKRLHLLRHAKSSWDDPTLTDHDRPLSRRGEEAGARLASWIAEHGPIPQLVLCSTATRARRTLELVLPSLDEPVVAFEDGLYQASAARLVERVASLDDALDDVLLVGHNPGLHDLALGLSAGSPSGERDRIVAKLPTGALVTVELDPDWAAARGGSGMILAVTLPREL